MAENTEISWCDATFNPWIGCTKVSTAATGGGGCDHCYAEVSTPARVLRAKGGETWGPGAPRVRTTTANWRQPLTWNAKPFFECVNCGLRTDNPLSAQCLGPERSQHIWGAARRRVFCASLADVFDNEVPVEWRADLFTLIMKTPHLDWLLLTKRIGNVERLTSEALGLMFDRPRIPDLPSLWDNVWLGATVVNQEEYDRDIGKLLRTPARIHFLSVEPMLGPIDTRMGGASVPDHADHRPLAPLDWVIVGGESGPHARPMHPAWARSLRDQCAAAGVPFHHKQNGEFVPLAAMPPSYGDDAARIVGCKGTAMYRVGKKLAGRLLDGIEHNGFPEAPK